MFSPDDIVKSNTAFSNLAGYIAVYHLVVHEFTSRFPTGQTSVPLGSFFRFQVLLIASLASLSVRYLPLVDKEGRPVSIVTSRDLIDFLSARIES